ncbi:23S rRNA (guanosine(2251)-2'-O)-methyltransferase RlmB [candidate division KSB1 bacterium]|nr:23S rRNA (guanosine(2251)-2'-O)-methyltransferase RlmB [candidate division KSB1 bacterium]
MPDLIIFGRQPVSEALLAGSPLKKIFIAHGSSGPNVAELLKAAEARHIPLQTRPRQELDRMTKTDKHQGVVALMPGVDYVDCETILEKARRDERGHKPAVMLLDSVEDPRNLGAILRVAEGAGLHGVVITKRRCAEVTAAAIKTSAGAAFHLPIAQVTNLSTTIELLKKQGLWIVGLEAEAKESIYAMDGALPLAVVMGSEGRGLHRLVREKCDFLYRIPMAGKLESLNVATAAAVVCFEMVRQRLKSGK